MNSSKTIKTLKAASAVLMTLAGADVSASVTSAELDLFDQSRERPVKVRTWYQPSEDCAETLCVAGNSEQDLPLAVISHGAFGSPREMNWLGYGLAAQGYLVVGVAHYGESWVYGQETVDRSIMAKKDLRPQDISFTLDQVMADNFVNRDIDTDKVTVFGHSLGGYTALSLVGADFNTAAMVGYCQQAIAKDYGCRYVMSALQVMANSSGQQPVQQSVRDQRVSSIVLLDPALGPAVSKQALANIDASTMVVGSVQNDFLPFDAHAGYYAESIDDATLVSLDQGEGHFVYLDKCDHQHRAMGISLCQDRDGVDRKQVHQRLMSEVSSFIRTL